MLTWWKYEIVYVNQEDGYESSEMGGEHSLYQHHGAGLGCLALLCTSLEFPQFCCPHFTNKERTKNNWGVSKVIREVPHGGWVELRSLKSGQMNHPPLQMNDKNLLLSSTFRRSNIFTFSPATITSSFFKGVLTQQPPQVRATSLLPLRNTSVWAEKEHRGSVTQQRATAPRHILTTWAGREKAAQNFWYRGRAIEETPPNSWCKFSAVSGCAGNQGDARMHSLFIGG